MSIEMRSNRPTIADEKLVRMVADEVLIAREMTKNIIMMISSIGEKKEEPIESLLSTMKVDKEKSLAVQTEYLDYFSRIAPSLFTREEWMNVFSKIEGVIDKLGGIAYRLDYLVSKPWELPTEVKDKMARLANALLDMVSLFYNMAISVTENPENSVRLWREVSRKEADIDDIYRAATFTILDAPLSTQFTILLLSIAEMLEDVADLVNSAADDLYLVVVSSS